MSDWRDRLAGRRVVAGISGGKDSAALSLWLTEQGVDHDRVFMDTGWEHPATYEYLRGDLTRAIGQITELRGRDAGGMVPLVRRKAMFPGRLRRFCTEELKIFPLRDYIASLGCKVVSAVGIRAEESAKRAEMPEWEWSDVLDADSWRPLLGWTLADIVEIHHRHNLSPNPLYLAGATRVGCWPCIHARKEEVRLIAETDPERIALIDTLERELSEKAGAPRAWFHGKTGRSELAPIAEVVKWATTDHGGKQYQLFRDESESGCVRWGLCDPESK